MTETNMNYYNKLIKFVNGRRKDNVKNFKMTHTSLGYPRGTFDFSGKSYHKFLDLYTKALQSDEKVNLHFVERPNLNGVTFLLLDVDYDQKDEHRQYSKNTLINLVKKVNNIIQLYYDVNNNDIKAYITEKPEPTKKGEGYKDGFHIYYPNIGFRECDRYFILDKLDKINKAENLFKGINYINESADNIIDKTVIKNNGIMMIGSKKLSGNPYYLTYIFDHKLNEEDINDCTIDEQINLLSNQRYDDIGYVKSRKNLYEKEIMKINSLYSGGNKKKANKIANKVKIKEYVSDDEDNSNDSDYSSDDEKSYDDDSIENKQDIELSRRLVPLLSKKRATEYRSWFSTGTILYSISPSLFDKFVEFSKKNMRKYKEDKISCKNVWDSAKKYSKSYDNPIAVLKHWARTDNSKKYFDIMRELNDPIFGKAETGSHVDIASVIYELYKDRFICVDKKRNFWYEFQDHKWVPIQSAYSLENVISDEFRNIFVMYCTDKIRESHINDSKFKDSELKKYSKLLGIAQKLGDIGFLTNVVKACANKFMDTKFEAKLNMNIYLVGFDNGVYDLKEKVFRDGMPSDMISISVCYNYEEMSLKDERVKFIKDYFNKIQVDEDMREYILTFIASILRGEPDQKFHIWTGTGKNGKSSTTELLKHAFGDYYGTLPTSYLTKPRKDSSGASPELACLPYCRIVVSQEPEPDDKIFVGKMKEITGGDSIPARALYGEPFEYKPQFSVVLPCNDPPTIPSNEEAVWRRLRGTPFKTKFVRSKKDIKTKYNFVGDNMLREKLKQMAPALMWYVLKYYYPKYEEGYNGDKYEIYEPEKVVECTKEYQKDSDIYMEFIENQLDITNNPEDKEQVSFIYSLFSDWYSTSYSSKPPPRKKFISYMKKNGYKLDKTNIYGIIYSI
jgi:P4 family phage/plasmid primase-like protien